jgi:hypothetical protein
MVTTCAIAQAFSQSFDGFRAKFEDVKLEVIEDSIAQVKGLPHEGEKWFKNEKLEDVPWSLFMVSHESTFCHKGIPITIMKPRWHNLILILK